MLDLKIVNGCYPDYGANKLVKGDIGIKDGKIVAIGEVAEDSLQCIDATNKVVSPGFIDIHMHEEDFINEGPRFIISEMMLRMGVTTCLGGNCGVQHQDISVFKDTIAQLGGCPVNYHMLVGYNAYRKKIGVDTYKGATAEQQEKLAQIMKRELEDGAMGFSFGIEYDPGIDTEEILNVLKRFKKEDPFVSAHYRTDATGAEESVKEMIEIAEKSGLRFQISHLSSCAALGQMDEVLEIINNEIEKNPRLNYDTYPYSAFSAEIGSAVFDDGCFDKWGVDYDSVLISDGKYKGKRCTKELFEEVRRETPQMLVVVFAMKENEIAQAITNKYGMVASDAIINGGKGHPRAAGTFPRVLGKYVREEQVLDLITALRKITLEPAERLRLNGKGRIVKGCDADITIFDPETIMDGANFDDINIAPTGIDYVYIGGKPAIEAGKVKNDRLGRFIL